ncbi:MAG: hypothetical protein JO266_20535 [Acidobacteria bacterium]|nr:hypothetical protein [Acidobacteriota bacterium]
METWHVEYENGCCSAVYDTLEEAKAAIAAQREANLRRYGKALRLASSEGQRMAISRKDFGPANNWTSGIRKNTRFIG